MYKILKIPTFAVNTPRWKMSVDLSDIRYQFYISWNSRIESWYMTISDMNDNILIGGIRLVPEIDLLNKYRATVPELPSGLLRIIDMENKMETAELTRDNFGTRFVLTYTITGA